MRRLTVAKSWRGDELVRSVGEQIEVLAGEKSGHMGGALDGGPPVSPVDFKKWQCPLSLFFKFSCRF